MKGRYSNDGEKKEENKYHYVEFSAEPNENIAVKIPNMPLDYNPEKTFFILGWIKEFFIWLLN